MTDSLKVLFAGTPDFAVPVLEALQEWCAAQGHELRGVLTQPDRPAGRGQALRQSPVKIAALKHDIEVFQPLTLKNSDAQAQLRAWQPDLMVVVAYGLLLPKEVLETPRLGCINVHASLLPRWRGAAPIQRAIAAGDTESGVAIMQMDEGLDTGPVWLERRVELSNTETGGSLHDTLSILGAQALIESLPDIVAQTRIPSEQSTEGVTYAHKLTKREAAIDWTQSAVQIEREIRAFSPWPVAHTRLDDRSIRIFAAHVVAAKSAAESIATSNRDSTQASGAQAHPAPGTIIQNDECLHVVTGDGLLHISELQPAGSRRMLAHAYLNARDLNGQVFSAPPEENAKT